MKRALLSLSLLVSSVVFAQASELENPGSVSAVQERAYRMNFEFDLAVGTLPLDAFYKGIYGQAGVVVHFSDTFAWQVGRGAYSYNISTQLKEQLKRDFGVLPTSFEEVQWFVGSDIMLKPFYGKTSVLNRWVVHFESQFILGVSLFKFASTFAPAINFGAGVRLFQTKYVSYRLDVTDNVVINPRGKTGNVLMVQLMLALNFGGNE